MNLSKCKRKSRKQQRDRTGNKTETATPCRRSPIRFYSHSKNRPCGKCKPQGLCLDSLSKSQNHFDSKSANLSNKKAACKRSREACGFLPVSNLLVRLQGLYSYGGFSLSIEISETAYAHVIAIMARKAKLMAVQNPLSQ